MSAAQPLPRHTVFHALEKASKAYRQFAQANIAVAGIDITIDQWLVLKTLQENPDIPLQQIAAMVFKDFASITRIVQALEEKGFVSRSAHERDGRRSALVLTRSGKNAIDELEPIIDSNRRRALRGIDRSEITRANALLDRIAANCLNGDHA